VKLTCSACCVLGAECGSCIKNNNNQVGDRKARVRLDRGVAHSEWMSLWPNSNVLAWFQLPTLYMLTGTCLGPGVCLVAVLTPEHCLELASAVLAAGRQAEQINFVAAASTYSWGLGQKRCIPILPTHHAHAHSSRPSNVQVQRRTESSLLEQEFSNGLEAAQEPRQLT
jgi:hypothetical protein